MTDDQKTKIRKILYELDGIEQAEEMIEAIEYLESNPFDEKAITYLKWFENKFHKADQDRRNFLDKLLMAYKEIKNLYIALAIESILLIFAAIAFIVNKI